MNISVIGTGYVGLVTGACFADMGNQVVCVDKDLKKIAALKKGIIPIYEPGLEEIVKRNYQEKRLSFTDNIKDAIKNSLICFIAVGTPPEEDGSADLSHVLAVAKEIALAMTEYKLIITKSTVPVGTSAKIKEIVSQNTKFDFDIVSNPEFLKEGSAVEDFMSPERIIIGTESKKAETILSELYEPFNRRAKRVLIMDNKSSELAKYAANAMLATRISFINEMANLAEILGADIEKVRIALASDSRIGSKFLFPGIGYGGSCFPKDVKAIIKTAKDNNFEMQILKAVEAVNQKQKNIIFEKIIKHYKGNIENKVFTIWGMSFKPNTDDIREAPALNIIENLLNEKAILQVYDPIANEQIKKVFAKQIKYFENSYDALDNANALIILTEWNEFRYPDFNKIKDKLKDLVIFDGRNLYSYEMLDRYKFKAYYSIGRK